MSLVIQKAAGTFALEVWSGAEAADQSKAIARNKTREVLEELAKVKDMMMFVYNALIENETIKEACDTSTN